MKAQFCLAAVFWLACGLRGQAQACRPATVAGGRQSPAGTSPVKDRVVLPKPAQGPSPISPAKRLFLDQKKFWSGVRDLDRNHLKTLLPVAGFAGALVAGDGWFSRQLSGPSSRSGNISQLATFSLAGAAGGAFVLGRVRGNSHPREAGLLSSEAALNSVAVSFALKAITQRERPLPGNSGAGFFQGGSAFPSQHAAAGWSVAGVLAHEYPGPLSRFLAYGLASAVSITRVTSREHSASDAFVGSALGWYMARSIYRAHRDPQLAGAAWKRASRPSSEAPRPLQAMSSPPVPLDNWVYPAFERLAAFGYIPGAYAGQRPWSRLECARLLAEAKESIGMALAGSEAEKLYRALAQEFANETRRLSGDGNISASLDSIYVRGTDITGPPLRDGYHFAQTVINDYGRPEGEGFNALAGLAASAVVGPLSFSLQGEYQHAPAVASDPAGVLAATAQQDQTLPLPNASPGTDRLRLLLGTAGFTFHNLQFTFGKQSLWLGPGTGSAFLWSDKSEPVLMLRLDQATPLRVPLLSRILGPVRTEFFLGQLAGQHWVFSDGTLFGPTLRPQPFLHGTKISFKPTSNFEFGMGFTVLFAGPGLPFTWHNFLRTFTSFNVSPGSAQDPGDRRSTFDFSYRVPGLRHWLTFYADSLVEDEFSPLGSTRPSMHLGIYFSHLPKAPKLDLRLEGLYTDVPGQKPGGFLYWNGRYRSGYTNDGNLLASWIGRQGRGGQAWASWWISPRNRIQWSYRHQETDQAFIGGGHLNDAGLRGEFLLRPDLSLTAAAQYEQWRFPVLSPTGHTNFTTSVELRFYPRWKMSH